MNSSSSSPPAKCPEMPPRFATFHCHGRDWVSHKAAAQPVIRIIDVDLKSRFPFCLHFYRSLCCSLLASKSFVLLFPRLRERRTQVGGDWPGDDASPFPSWPFISRGDKKRSICRQCIANPRIHSSYENFEDSIIPYV